MISACSAESVFAALRLRHQHVNMAVTTASTATAQPTAMPMRAPVLMPSLVVVELLAPAAVPVGLGDCVLDNTDVGEDTCADKVPKEEDTSDEDAWAAAVEDDADGESSSDMNAAAS